MSWLISLNLRHGTLPFPNNSVFLHRFIVAIDGDDVTGLSVNEITAIMTKKYDMERLLTVITSTHHESKSVGTL